MTGKKKSQKRQRNKQIKSPCTTDEFNAISTNATRAGLTRGAFLRAAGLGDPGPRSKRLHHPHETLLRQILAQCGKIGGNINQMTYRLHTAKVKQPPEFTQTRDAILDIRNAIFDALGVPRKPSPEVPHDHQGKKPD